ncbi:MAG: chloride channel protein [Candidatus Schekmanbacteria bacterium]|nr:chloride channel protein [Candidatus Schekmanbacteria bacterium]
MSKNWRDRLRIESRERVYLYALLIGIAAGLFAAAFAAGLAALESLLQDGRPTGAALRGAPAGAGAGLGSWLLVFLPVVGGLVSGLLTHFFAPEAAGPGTAALVNDFHNREGIVRGRVAIVKGLSSMATLASGGSAGKEGPLAQMGAAIGSWWAQVCGAGSRARRTLMLAGAAGGLGAIFRAPLGGALTVIEVLYRDDFESDALVPCTIASLAGYATMGALLGTDSIFRMRADLAFNSWFELLFYAVLGLLCYPVGALFISAYHFSSSRLFPRLPLRRWMIPAMGGIGTATVGLAFPQILGSGFGFLQAVMLGDDSGIGHMGTGLFLALAFAKLVATCSTVGSGASGGIFAPSLFIGGMLGGFVGSLAQALAPGAVPSLAPYIIVGMGGFFAGVANAPLGTLIMVCEMTRGYALLVPLIVVSLIAMLLNRGRPIYPAQVDNRFASPAHLWNMRPDVLQRLRVGELGPFARRSVVLNTMSLSALQQQAQESRATDFIVVDAQDRYVGGVSLRHVFVDAPDAAVLENLLLVHEIAHATPAVTVDDDLRAVMARLLDADLDKIAVLEGDRVIGYLHLRDILRAYGAAVARLAPPQGTAAEAATAATRPAG